MIEGLGESVLWIALDFVTGPVSSINAQTESHGSSSEEVDEPSSRGSSRPNSAHEEQVRLVQSPFICSLMIYEIAFWTETAWVNVSCTHFLLNAAEK